jgi:hypothetical protein
MLWSTIITPLCVHYDIMSTALSLHVIETSAPQSTFNCRLSQTLFHQIPWGLRSIKMSFKILFCTTEDIYYYDRVIQIQQLFFLILLLWFRSNTKTLVRRSWMNGRTDVFHLPANTELEHVSKYMLIVLQRRCDALWFQQVFFTLLF